MHTVQYAGPQSSSSPAPPHQAAKAPPNDPGFPLLHQVLHSPLEVIDFIHDILDPVLDVIDSIQDILHSPLDALDFIQDILHHVL